MYSILLDLFVFSWSDFASNAGTLGIWIASITLTAFLVQTFFYTFFFGRLPFYKIKTTTSVQEPVSIVICARNEAENLKNFLPSVLEQDYPNYEVIVVDDCSTDDTPLLLAQMKEQYPHLYYTTIQPDRKFSHGKKLALTIGVKAAKNEWMVFTDADCKPVSNLWINRMQRNFTDQTQFVLGYGGYFKKSSLLNLIIRYDTLYIALTYFSFSIAGLPYMGVGRNMAYRKSMFFEKKGFGVHKKLMSGDDDLFVNKHATRKNTRIEISPDSLLLSLPQMSWKAWVNQKRRHFTTARYYKWIHKILLAGEPLSRMLFYAGIVLWIVLKIPSVEYALAILGLRLIYQLLILGTGFNRFNEKVLVLFVPLLDIVLPLLHSFIYLINLVSKKHIQWK